MTSKNTKTMLFASLIAIAVVGTLGMVNYAIADTVAEHDTFATKIPNADIIVDESILSDLEIHQQNENTMALKMP